MGRLCLRFGCEILLGILWLIPTSWLQAKSQHSVFEEIENKKDTIPPLTLYYLFGAADSSNRCFLSLEHKTEDLHTGKDFFPYAIPIGQSLSTQGSAYKPLTLETATTLTRKFIFNATSNSFHTRENVRFYQVNHPYTYLSYLGGTQSTNAIRAIHSQNIEKGWNVAVDMKAFLTDGQFHRSGVKSQSFQSSTNYISPKGRYRIQGGYLYNKTTAMENGGLLFDTVFTESTISNTDAMPIRLVAAQNVWRGNEFFYAQYLNLNAYDTTHDRGSILNNGVLSHKAIFQHHKKVFTDELAQDSAYAGFFISNITTEDSLAHRVLSNTIQWSNDAYDDRFYFNPLILSAGVTHSLYQFHDISTRYNGQRWQPFVFMAWREKYFSLSLLGEYVFSRQEDHGEQHIATVLSIPKLCSLHQIRFLAEWRKEAPELFFQHLHGNHFQWNNNFLHTNTWHLHFSFSPYQGLVLGTGYYRRENHVYLNEDKVPVVATQSSPMLLGYLKHHLRFGSFRFEGCLQLQHSDNDEVFRLPFFAAKETFAIHFELFKKKLNTCVGMDISYHSKYFADGYDPVLGAFYRQNTVEIGNYVYTDVFIEAKVEDIRLFFMVGHPYAGLLGRNYFNTPHYPHENVALRWGVSWEFGD